MEFRTKVALPSSGFTLSLQQRVLFLGSCFAENIGHRLAQEPFACRVNPFGVLYNPVSIARMMQLVCGEEELSESFFFSSNEEWHSWLNDSEFDSSTAEDCCGKLTARILEIRKELERTDILFLTLGTSRCYIHKELNFVVGNCHKQPDRTFREEDLSIWQMEDVLSAALECMWRKNPHLQVVFTVSPYRYAKYGFHESQLSKAKLLLSIEQLQAKYEQCSYFPAYEIVMDELRDYRFYADDMLHPSVLAIDYIWECFSDVYFSEDTRLVLKEWKAVRGALNHKPRNPDSEAYKDFLRKTLLKLEQLKEKYPKLAVETEYKKIVGLLK